MSNENAKASANAKTKTLQNALQRLKPRQQLIALTAAPPLDVSKTILAHEQSLKTLRNFLNMCRSTPETAQNHISLAVFSVISLQLDVLQTLANTLKEDM